MFDHPNDYCNKPEELTKNPNAKKWLKAAANGNDAAYEFLWHFWCFVNCYDDLVDKDREVTVHDAARTFMEFFRVINTNPFYLAHKSQLFPLVTQTFNRWIDGDEWEKSEDRKKRIMSMVIRCGDLDLYLHVAYLCGGWDHMRNLKELRCYDDNGVIDKEIAAAKGA